MAEQRHPLGGSDEDFIKNESETFYDDEPVEQGEVDLDGEEEQEESDDIDDNEEFEEDSANSDSDHGDDGDDDDSDVDDESEDPESDSDFEKDEDVSDESSDKKENEEEKESETLNSEEVLAPLKAAGKTYQPANVDELRKFAQMGIDYYGKMQGIKPALKLQKTFNSRNISEDDVNFLIDLHSGSQEAIAKLLKNHNVDPMDLDIDATANQYQKTDHTMSDEEYSVNEVIDKLKTSDNFGELKSIVETKWDDNSVGIIQKSPNILETLNEHMSTKTSVNSDESVYDRISAEVDKRRMLGELDGVSDLEAYYSIGSQLFGQGQPDQQQDPMTNNTENDTKNTPDDERRQKRRKAASSITKRKTRSRKPPEKGPAVHPLSGTDEEFLEAEKLAQSIRR